MPHELGICKCINGVIDAHSPVNVQTCIFAQLNDIQDLMAVSCVSRAWHQLIQAGTWPAVGKLICHRCGNAFALTESPVWKAPSCRIAWWAQIECGLSACRYSSKAPSGICWAAAHCSKIAHVDLANCCALGIKELATLRSLPLQVWPISKDCVMQNT